MTRPYRRRNRIHWANVPGSATNFRGPNRALSLDEQLEVQRLMREATSARHRGATAIELARRYGVSSRTIWRYVVTMPTPPGLEHLTIRIKAWAAERDIDLTYDDLASLLLVVARHREFTGPLDRVEDVA